MTENSRREKMGKKYLDTKKGTLESSILGVWKTAIEEGDARMDGRTKEYREHRKKLESARARRVNKEEVVNEAEVDPKDREELAFKKKSGDTAKSVKKAQEPAPNQMAETNKNDKSDDGEGLDAVQPKAVKKKFKDRKDKDIDNDGDTDDADKFLHKKRKAISKAMAKEEVDLDDNAEMIAQVREFKIQSMKAALAQVWGMEEGKNPFVKDPKKEEKKPKTEKTMTGKKATEVKVDPELEEKKDK